MSKEHIDSPSNLEQKESQITQCEACKSYHGVVREKYNGEVPVICHCQARSAGKHRISLPSPSMMSQDGISFYWTPTTNYKIEDGTWWHRPYFGGPPVPHENIL